MTDVIDCDIPEAVRSLENLIREGFENPEGTSGKVQFYITTESLRIPMAVCFVEQNLTVSHSAIDRPDSTLTMPIQTAQLIIKNVTDVDYRDPDIIGNIKIEGELDLINQVAKSLLRPSNDTLERFGYAQNRNAKSYSMNEIARVSNPTELQILEAIAESRPIIITDLDTKVPVSDWSLERLVNDYRNVPLRVRSADQEETVAEFVNRITSTELDSNKIIEGHTKAYTEGCSLPEEMHNDFLPNHFSLDDYIAPQIWLGSVPVDVPASSLHHDPLDGFLYQILGRKKLVLYSPDQAPYLYPMKAYNNYQPCWVKPEEPDYGKFPLFRKARSVEVTLNPGELLVQPAGWFHAVYCLDSPTFSVSYFLRH